MSKSSPDALHLIEKELSALENYSASATQLITFCIPGDTRLEDVLNRISSEEAEAQNIKSKQTRKNVQRGLNLAYNKFSEVGVPENGVCVFCGVTADEEISKAVSPPFPINSYVYECGKTFNTDSLQKQIADTRETFILLLLDRNNGHIGVLHGSVVEHRSSHESNIQGKHKMGGQSQKRFERLIEESLYNFFKDIASEANSVLDEYDTNRIIIGGEYITISSFVSEDLLRHDADVLSKVSVGNVTANGYSELLSKSSNVIENERLREAKETCEKFLKSLSSDGEHVQYGEEEVRQAVEYGAVETLLIGQDLVTQYEPLQENVTQKGGEIVEIPDTFEKGRQFHEAFDGLGAILRFNV